MGTEYVSVVAFLGCYFGLGVVLFILFSIVFSIQYLNTKERNTKVHFVASAFLTLAILEFFFLLAK